MFDILFRELYCLQIAEGFVNVYSIGILTWNYGIMFYVRIQCYVLCFLGVLTIFNEGAYLTFKSIFHKAFKLF